MSRDGHEFHEAWAAREALKLIMPTDDFIGIAVEGLSPVDQAGVSAETVEIADIVLYYGKHPTFDKARSIVIVQMKYSISAQDVPYRISDAKKTIKKFAIAFLDHKGKYGAEDVKKKLTFELITNRPVYPEFADALSGLAFGAPLSGEVNKQANQFKSACGLEGENLVEFAQKVRIGCLAGNLRKNKQLLARTLADWSAAPDAMARARLGSMRQLLRDKAGLAGESNNVITRIDVLDALDVQSPEDLFPCPASFPEVGKVVKREQLSTVVNRIPNLNKPLLIHAEGGAGKTVFLQSLAKSLDETHEVVLFDCFGGGAYRAPEDARHLPNRGLIHIINSLACKGLCDPLLPSSVNVEELVKAFKARLAQAVTTMQRASPGKQFLLFIDAIDNAAEHAKDKEELAFPRLLLESFHYNGPVAGVQLIVSCRTYRRDISRGNLPRRACEEIKLEPFSFGEAGKYLRDRLPEVTDTQIQVAYSRSEGNARILEHLAYSDRGLLDPSEINNVIKLDDLIKGRIKKSLVEALKHGYKEPEINSFLAGLSVLPPPVPLDEYADAHGMDLSAVKSFAADLAPLLEQTRHGLIFRDEPTETLVREVYATQTDTLYTLAENLFKKQDTSVYAASALPGLLQKLDNEKLLFDLAFDERFPTAITSAVGKQNIRYARLKAAVLHAARKKDFDRLLHLLVELSTLASINQRGTDYLIKNPDLVIASHDVDATRRLFETRTRWPGARHARLTIASVLSGDLSDACRHAVQAEEWIRHFYRQNDEYRRDRGGPKRLDIASIPLCLVAQDRSHDAAQFMRRWKDWYTYEVAEHIFALLHQGERMETIPAPNIRSFLDALKSQPGILAAALSFMELDNDVRRRLIGELAEACEKKTLEISNDSRRERNYLVQDGFLKAAAISASLEMYTEASVIAGVISYERPRLWSFTDQFPNEDAFPFIIYMALRAALEHQSITEQTLLPQELIDIGARVPTGITGDVFRKMFKAELEDNFKLQKGLPDDKKSMSYDTKRNAENFIDEQLESLVEMTRVFAAMLSSSAGKGDRSFLALVDVWAKLRMKQGRYSDMRKPNLFFNLLGRQCLIFSLWVRNDLKASSVEAFVAKVSEEDIAPASMLVEITAILSKRPTLHELAGRTALKAKTLIEREDEVSYRASLFAQLSKAIMPASFEEAASYFRAGLEQLDAIGSGDYQFTNELLLFAAELRGDELEEGDFHTLSNICELNMHSEEEKFPWLAFARGLARTSGCRALAKLGRWDDRGKISLDYTLLPYLTALIEQDKIDPCIGLGLLRISAPVELWVCDTQQLAEVIAGKRYPNSKELLTELIYQFEQNYTCVLMPRTLATLGEIAEREFGKDSEHTKYLSVAAPKFKKLLDEENENRNYRGTHNPCLAEKVNDQEEEHRRILKKIEDETDLTDEASMSRAIDALTGMQYAFDLKGTFFENLRGKVKYAERQKYIQIIARLEALDIYTKLRVLKKCKEEWNTSSAALGKTFHDIGVPLIHAHADEFVYFEDYLAGSQLKEIAELSSIPMPVLVLELILIFAAPDSHLPASIWMSLATIICKKTKQGEGQIALKRLLNSNSAKLASTVVDGIWKDDLYPKNGEVDIAAGLVWLKLGSPSAAYRWRAAHSIRCFARFGKWAVIDALIRRLHSTDALPYQASELPFYFLHARLWLLIAINRVAMDHPQNVAKYAEVLMPIALDKKNTPHVLLRHFAAQTLLTCARGGGFVLSEEDAKALKTVNDSPYPKKKAKEYPRESFYTARPDSIPKPEPEFYIDYDFDKTDVSSVSEVFDRSRWETKDAMTAWIRKFDSHITHMNDSGGRSISHQNRIRGMTAQYHRYGQQLGWHALFQVAGEFLRKYPVVQRPYDDDSWREWLRRELLTRNDGLWLADGVDSPPLGAQVNLYEKGEKELVLTSDKAKILSLLNIESFIAEEIVVFGDWRSNDGIEIHISSALVPPHFAEELGLQLSQEDPYQAWLPQAESYEDGEEYSHSEKKPFVPWIVSPYIETRLDETDPFGVSSAVRRPRFTKEVNAIRDLKAVDSFNRTWTNAMGKAAARSEAWGRNRTHYEDESISSERLVCSSDFLKDVLMERHAELLALIILRRYEKGLGSRDSQFWHTTAVVRIKQSLDFEYYPGLANKLY